MGVWELFVIAVGVSMDAFAVAVCKGLSVTRVRMRHIFLTALWFGGFQALMPVLGYCLGISFSDFLADVDHWIAFILLGFIGGNMIKESFDRDNCEISPDFSFKVMFALAVATSIDALAVGVSFAFLNMNLWTAVFFIGITTAVFSGTGILVGNYFGCKYKYRAEFVGGLILILMGIKILVTHLMA